MSFDEKIVALIQRLPKLTDHLQSEEATKNALVMPFISALGYDVLGGMGGMGTSISSKVNTYQRSSPISFTIFSPL